MNPFKPLVCSLFLLLGMQAFAQNKAAIRQQQFNLDNGVILKGYDAVSYLDEQKAVKGFKQFAVNYQGITYYFASAAHAKTFQANPAKYEPAYGGWCAYAMGSSGDKVDFDPEKFKIVDGKTNLFFSNWLLGNTLPKWNADEKNLKTKAVVNWAKFYKE